MFRHFLRIALRMHRRRPAYSLMNAAGLSIGLACCILIMVYVLHETSYDDFHGNADLIVRVRYTLNLNGIVYDEASIPFPAAPALARDFPEVAQAVRLYRDTESPLITVGDRKFTEERFFFADSNLFDVFDLVMIRGDRVTALREPHSVVLSERVAKKYFGNDDPIGKTIRYNNGAELKVSGVTRDLPGNAHFHCDLLAPLSFQLHEWERVTGQEGREKKWIWTGAWTYLMLSHDGAAGTLSPQLGAFVQRYFPDRLKGGAVLSLQPLRDIHLHSHLDNEIEPNGDSLYVTMFSVVAFLILTIACINFVNLSTAQSSLRAKEVGIRKVVGAGRMHLAGQLIGETALTSVLAMLFAVVLVEILLPRFNLLIGRSLEFNITEDWRLALMLPCLLLITVLLSGVYPAMMLSNLDIIGSVRKRLSFNAGNERFRRGLVVIQFSVSVILIVGIIVVYQQLRFMQSKDLGFNKEHVIFLKASPGIERQFDVFRNTLLGQPGVLAAARTSNIPGEGAYGYRFVPEGTQRDKPVMLPLLLVDMDFLETMNIHVTQGRAFSRMSPADTAESFLLNEKAVEQLGWQGNPIGRKFELYRAGSNEIEKSGHVVGVIQSYHFESLHHEVKPLVVTYSDACSYYAIRIGPGHISDRLAAIERAWNKLSPEWPMEYMFLDRRLDALYGSEQELADLVKGFAVVAALLACLGLLGLSIFAVERRTKEIGVRKVLGATTFSVLQLLSRDFMAQVFMANLIAWPLAWYITSAWLQNFAYRIDLTAWPFILATFLAMIIALSTVSFHAIRAAMTNPVESLRYE